jgi:hypothetical protein
MQQLTVITGQRHLRIMRGADAPHDRPQWSWPCRGRPRAVMTGGAPSTSIAPRQNPAIMGEALQVIRSLWQQNRSPSKDRFCDVS